MNDVMDWNNALGTKPPGIEETHRKIQQRNTRLDNINKCIQSLTARCRERDVVAEKREQDRIHTKIKQRARYQKAALFGADLYSRLSNRRKIDWKNYHAPLFISKLLQYRRGAQSSQ